MSQVRDSVLKGKLVCGSQTVAECFIGVSKTSRGGISYITVCCANAEFMISGHAGTEWDPLAPDQDCTK